MSEFERTAHPDGAMSGGDCIDARPSEGTGGNVQKQHVGDNKEVDPIPNDQCIKYKMDYQCIGYCIIFNNKHFDPQTGMNVRNGTDEDVGRLQKTFKSLGFNVQIHNDKSCSDMSKTLVDVSMKDHTEMASFVCVILSHGEEGLIYGTDGAIKFNELIRVFKGNNCKTLLGKPKMFFVQACRGNEFDSGVEVDSVGEENSSQKIPIEADFLYVYSTAPGYYSWRNTSKGSWFIESLCHVLNTYGKKLEIMQILTKVNHKVALEFESVSAPEYSGMKQIPCIISMLTKEVYFNH
ncbi:caspase-3 [Callorhinchus milii]|uniref:caspase-3 n=1 Tax=Callorhinchus milii TaxID=7868 RepID=UPI001C3F9E37|nr:caspase-3 [Callorhinchus milii]XP_007905081.2 caspase-3 [Callorhinchus milii]